MKGRKGRYENEASDDTYNEDEEEGERSDSGIFSSRKNIANLVIDKF